MHPFQVEHPLPRLVPWVLALCLSGCAEPVAAPEQADALMASAMAAPIEAQQTKASLPGQAARKVLDEQVDEAENLFFTDDGRLFVSGGEDIYEVERAADGTFTKTDHFHEDCLVEGIVEHRGYLYGVCWLVGDLQQRTFLIAGELSADPVFRIIAPLETGAIPNGMTVDPEGRVYVTDSLKNQVLRLTFGAPLELVRKEVWAAGLMGVNGIKHVGGAMYATMMDASLNSWLIRIPLLADGRAGKTELLFKRWLTVLDDIIPYEGGLIITDFLTGTLIFWDAQRGAYAETPKQTFYGPTSLALGRPPMFAPGQLVVAEKGNFLIRREVRGDLLSMYQLP